MYTTFTSICKLLSRLSAGGWFKTSASVKACNEDVSSLTIDLSKLSNLEDRLDCPAYKLQDCGFKMDQIEAISADISMEDCERTWACPFWITPETWVHLGRPDDQFLSGEIDLFEIVGADDGRDYHQV